VRKNRLSKLLEKARVLKGSRLSLDLHTGEVFLKRFVSDPNEFKGKM